MPASGTSIFLPKMVPIVWPVLNRISRKGLHMVNARCRPLYCISHYLVLYNEYIVVIDGWQHMEKCPAYSFMPIIDLMRWVIAPPDNMTILVGYRF